MRPLIKNFLAAVSGYFKRPAGRRQYFDENLAADQWDLLEAAALLEVTEFRVFELAYRQWYGITGRHHVIEEHFRRYMFGRVIPAWVSHFARRVVELGQSGALDPRDFGIYPRQPSRRMIRIGQVYTAMLLAIFVLLLYMAYGDTFLAALPNDPGLPQHNTMP